MENTSRETDASVLSSAERCTAPISPLLRLGLILIGLTAIIAQIVLMRELVVVFYGNEISFGIILANWLLWTAVGSGPLGRLVPRARSPRRLLAALQTFIAVVFPATILCLRASKYAFQPTPGEVLGPWPMFLTSLVVLSLFCSASGLLFAAGSQAYAREAGASAGHATSSVYLLEAVGSGAGGLLASLVLIRYLGAFQIALVLSFLNLLAAANLMWKGSRRRRLAITAVVGLAAALVTPPLSRRLDRVSRSWLWHGFEVVTARDSIYGNLAVIQAESARSLYENGLVISTVPDPAAAEEAVHFALLQHPAPASLLLIGGGMNGSVAQALQHRTLRRVDYVELDPTIFELARAYFPSEWSAIRSDPRVRIHPADGRLYLKTTSDKFDVIIVNLPDPQTAQLNRFYTLEFFRTVAARLTPGGVFSFQLRSAEDYISPELADFLSCIRKTLGEVFPEITFVPGATVHFFAAQRPGVLTNGPSDLLGRLRARQVHTDYVREYYIPFRMSPDRMLDLELQLRPHGQTPINRDFAPVAYYFEVALWSKRFNPGYRRLFQSLAGLRFEWLAAGAGVLTIGLAAALGWRRQPMRRRRSAAGFSVAVTGFTLMGLELLLLLGFQAIYGYVYHQLAIVIAAFMVGMAVGSWLALRQSRSLLSRLILDNDWLVRFRIIQPSPGASRHPLPSPRGEGISSFRDFVPLPMGEGGAQRRVRVVDNCAERDTNLTRPANLDGESLRCERLTLGGVQILIGLAPLLLYALFGRFDRIEGARQLLIVSQILFPALALLCGLMGGYQFPVASRVFFGGPRQTVQGPGPLYALDLLGACLGAVLLSTYLVPVFGFGKTALLTAVLNLAPAGLALWPSGTAGAVIGEHHP